MILLADGGSTKVDWCLLDQGKQVKQLYTKGANPFFRNREDIAEELSIKLAPELKDLPIGEIWFYGAGCVPEKQDQIRGAIQDTLSGIRVSQIHVGSDLLAAARGLCKHQKGIACIIGTGSNSCYYDGEEIRKNISPLGYILGDEGSGAVLGRLFLGACLKNQLTPGLKELFLKEMDLTQSEILDRVYKQPMPNRFLASLSPFLLRYIGDQSVYGIVYSAFIDFFKKNVMQYDYKNLPVSFTGSVAFHFQSVLKEAAAGLNTRIGVITQSPMEGLIQYHSTLKKQKDVL